MGRILLSIGAEFLWRGAVYRIVRHEGDNFTAKILNFANQFQQFTLAQILNYANNGELTFKHLNLDDEEDEEESGKPPSIKKASDLDQLDKEIVAVAEFRLMSIETTLSAKPRVNLKEVVENRLKELREEGHEVSRTRFYAWRKAYLDSGRDIRALLSDRSRQGGTGQSRMAKEAAEVLKKLIGSMYLKPNPATGVAIYNELITEIGRLNKARDEPIKIPSQKTVYRELDKIDVYEVMMKQRGRNYTYSHLGYVSSSREMPTYPLQVVQADHTTMDIILVDDVTRKPIGRPIITVLLDVFTRMPHGINISFKPPSYESVMLALKNAIAPKNAKEKYNLKHEWSTYGLPEILMLDNGKDFRSKHLKHACDLNGIELDYNLPQSPWQKPEIERFFNTMNSQLIHMLDGTTFSNAKERKDRGYNSVKEAGISYPVFLEVFHKWMVDYYCQSFHEGLEHFPSQMWEQHTLVHPPHLPDSMTDCSISLCPIATRTIQKKGIEWEKHWYQSTALWELHHELLTRDPLYGGVTLKYDPSDISRIYVMDDFRKQYMEVLCTDLENTAGVPLAIAKAARQEVNELRKTEDESELADTMSSYLNKARKDAESSKKIRKNQAEHKYKSSNQSKSNFEAAEQNRAKKAESQEEKRQQRTSRYATELEGGAYYA